MTALIQTLTSTSILLFLAIICHCAKAETIMVPGIASPEAKLSVLGGLLGRDIYERQQRCRDPTATLCLGGFCCARGSFCQPNNREYGQNCCPDTALNCNGGTACCPSDSVCCSLEDSPTGCCIFTYGGGGSRPPPLTTRRTTFQSSPTTRRTAFTETRIETFDTSFPTSIPTFLTQTTVVKFSPMPSISSFPTGFSLGNSVQGRKDDCIIFLCAGITMINVAWAIGVL